MLDAVPRSPLPLLPTLQAQLRDDLGVNNAYLPTLVDGIAYQRQYDVSPLMTPPPQQAGKGAFDVDASPGEPRGPAALRRGNHSSHFTR